MEYSALNDVAMKFGIALIGFKGISDGEKPLTGELVQWTELLPVIDKNLAEAIISLKAQIAQGKIRKKILVQMPPHWRPEHGNFGTLGRCSKHERRRVNRNLAALRTASRKCGPASAARPTSIKLDGFLQILGARKATFLLALI
jgi:hypothetical protein